MMKNYKNKMKQWINSEKAGLLIIKMRGWFLLLLFMTMTSIDILGRSNNQLPGARPNIILIVADDLGFSDLGFMGSEINTPNLNRLASGGLVITQFYNAGRCCPSRASLLTGLYQHQAGVGDMTQNRGYPAYQGFLNKNCVTIAEVLRQAGYTTAMTGKWHVGEEKQYWPQKRGFDNFYGIPQGGGAYFYPFLVKRELWLNDNVVTPPGDFYSTEAFNDYAAKFVEAQKNSDRPFFLYLAHIAPHFPLQARQADIEKYRGHYKTGFEVLRNNRWKQQQQLGLFKPGVKPSLADSKVEDWNQLSSEQQDTFDLKMATYAAQVESMDRGIGEIISRLEETNQLDNTLILFISDNGGESDNAYPVAGASGPIGSATSWTSYGASWAYASNTPFKKYKKFVQEGGIRTPLIVYYPAMIKKGRIEHYQAGHVIDIMPTLLSVAGAPYPKSFNGHAINRMVGKSLLPIFKNEKMPVRTFFWEHEGNRAVRSDNWKLVSTYPEDKWQLYNLADDPTELTDLAASQPAQAKKLEGLYKNWAKESNVLPWDKIVNDKKEKL
jgi:arylsulfatase A-like enzyme